MRDSLVKFFNEVFYNEYPYDWTLQVLRPEKKKGHTSQNPKLRGVAISSLLPTLYDIILDKRFNKWYKINAEQAGFREHQGCTVQLFAIYLLMELLKSRDEELFVGFIDYEKAFDFTNRAEIVKDLMLKKVGSVFTRAIARMYRNTYYIPKVSKQRTGEPIRARHGVTQGQKTAANLFSFAISDIPKAIQLNDSLDGNSCS